MDKVKGQIRGLTTVQAGTQEFWCENIALLVHLIIIGAIIAHDYCGEINN